MIFLIVFCASYVGTDADYQKLLANSSQLSDFNGCGDKYMHIDVDMVFKNIDTSRNNLRVGVFIAVLALIIFAVQAFCVVLRVLRWIKPAY